MTKTRKNVEGLTNTLTVDFTIARLAPTKDSDEIKSDLSGGLNVSFTKKQSNSNKCIIPDNGDEALKIEKGNNKISFDTTGNNLNVHSNLDISGGTLKTTKKIICKNIQISASNITNISGDSISLSGCDLNVSDKYTGDTSGVLIGNIAGNVTGKLIGDLTGNLDGEVGEEGINANTVNGTVIEATTKFIGELSGNIIGDVSGNILGVINAGNIYASDVYTSDKFIGNLSGTAYLVTNGLVIGDSITDLIDVDLSGSGEIITDSERSKLEGIEEGANNYSLPTASGVILGGVKIGNNISINDGTISIPRYLGGYGLDLNDHTFSVNTNDLSDNVVLLTGGQTINGVKTFGQNIIGNISGNATTVTNGLTTNSEVTDLSGMTSTGSGKVISDVERTVLNNISGIDLSANFYTMPIATTTISGAIIVGNTLSITDGILTTNNQTDYVSGYGLTLSGDTFSVNTNDLSDNIVLLTGNQTVNGVKTFSENIIGNISGNATTVTNGLTTSSEVTDLSGMTSTGSGKVISDAERTVLNNISGVDTSANFYTMPIATTTVSGAIIVGDRLSITGGVLNSSGAEHFAGSGITLGDTTFSVNTNDLSDTIVLVTGNQIMSGVKTFNENIIGNISGNATTVTNGLTTSSEVTDLSGMTSAGGGKVISDAERTALNNISGIDLNANFYTMPLATTSISGAIIVGDTLSITDGKLNASASNIYTHGYGLTMSGDTFSVNTNDLSNNIVLLTGNQNISGVKTFSENIIGNISGNATTVTDGLTTGSEVTDLSGMTSTGSGKVISDAERTTLNNISGIDLSANFYTMPLATTSISGAIIVGDTLTITNGILSSSGAEHFAGSGITLSGDTFSVNTNDLSDNFVLLTENQNISGVKTFNENIIGNISGNATTVTGGLTTGSEVTDLSGMTSTGSGKVISNAERTALNNISGIDLSANFYTMPIATTSISGAIIVGNTLTISGGIISSSGAEHFAGTGITLSDTTFSVNTNDLSDTIILLTGDQNISGLKSFDENIIGNISGNATTVTGGLTTSSEVTDLSGMTSIGSGKVISDVERTTLYNISGVTSSTYSLPLVSVIPSSFTTAPTGGTITDYTYNGVEYKVHTFLSSGNFVVTDGMKCDFLVVGGGAGGGREGGGGGGAGGVYYNVNETFSPGTYVITIGGGGGGATSSSSNGVGGSSSAIVLTSASFSKIGIGGGGGRSKTTSSVSDGGSGGGGDSNEEGRYFPGQTNQGNTYWNGHIFVAGGNNGGFREVSTESSGNAAGGGGGAGSKGYRGQWDGNVPPSENSDTSGGRGGDGIYNEWRGDISGNNAGNLTTGVRNYAAGGGGGNWKGHTHGGRGGGGTLDSALIPGSGGGGKGRTKLVGTGNFNSSDNGVENTGGGGGGGGESGAGGGDANVGGDGGKGIVMIRYALNGIFGGVKIGNKLSIDTNGVITPGFTKASTQNIGLVKIDNSSNIVINNNFITTKLPIISNYRYLFTATTYHNNNSSDYSQLGDTGTFNKSFSHTKIFISTYINCVVYDQDTNYSVWFQIKLYDNNDVEIASTPDISRQLHINASSSASIRSNTINNLSYIIDDVNIIGSINVKLFLKTINCYARFQVPINEYLGLGHFNIEFIEYD